MIATGRMLKNAADHVLDPSPTRYDPISVDIHVLEKLTLEPRSFGTVPALQTFFMPADLACLLTGRSSHMRQGIYMPGGWIDPGMEGEVMLEFFNMSDHPQTIKQGEAGARLVFFKLTEKVDGYNGRWSR